MGALIWCFSCQTTLSNPKNPRTPQFQITKKHFLFSVRVHSESIRRFLFNSILSLSAEVTRSYSIKRHVVTCFIWGDKKSGHVLRGAKPLKGNKLIFEITYSRLSGLRRPWQVATDFKGDSINPHARPSPTDSVRSSAEPLERPPDCFITAR